MLYTELKIKDRTYKLRLNARNCVDLEKSLGENPLNVLSKASNGEIPSLEVMLAILHASLLTYEHGISLNDTYDLYDNYIDDGNTLVDLIPVIIDIFRCSGFFKEDKSKNVKKRVEK